MIEYRTGDLFESGAIALVNPVNCRGVMGKGLAKEFKERFPENFRGYQQACRDGRLQPGGVVAERSGGSDGTWWILNAATKDDWRKKAKLAWVANCILRIRHFCQVNWIETVAIPPLGCGLGGLRWDDVSPFVHEAFAGLPNTLALVYEPH